MKEAPKCILFDCDGVLVDSEPITARVLVEMSQAIGIDIDVDFVEQRFLGNSWAGCAAILEEEGGKKLPDNFEQEYRHLSSEAFKKEIQPIRGIPELIDRLTIPFAVASSGPTAKIRLNLGLIGLLDRFEENIFSCWDLQKWKPDPAIYLHAAEVMGFAPKDCMVVEDSIFGVKAGLAGGFRTVGYASPHTEEALQELGAEVIYEMETLHEMVPVR
ncbi:MAG: HAD family hydrolase [Bacteroidota bacterium]